MAKKVMVGMSGGVDSAVCAYLLKKADFEVSGVNCRFFNKDDAVIANKACCNPDDIEDARKVAEKLGIEFDVFDFSQAFSHHVMDRFVKSYIEGSTPNPCICCNRYLKFDELLEKATLLGYDYIATGHYAIVEYSSETGRYLLKKGADESKDQSYVLYSLTQHQLAHTLFPLGGMTKAEVRSLAEQLNLVNARKHDSQDICFVPDGDYASFIERRTGMIFPDGDFIDENGKVLGKHKGIIRYTIGQRKGLGIALQKPVYVCKKDVSSNTVTLCDNEQLFTRELTANDINLISVESIISPMRVKAKIRYKHTEQWATVEQLSEDRIKVVFDEPQRAIAKGQAVVLYDGDIVVGGGTIE